MKARMKEHMIIIEELELEEDDNAFPVISIVGGTSEQCDIFCTIFSETISKELGMDVDTYTNKEGNALLKYWPEPGADLKYYLGIMPTQTPFITISVNQKSMVLVVKTMMMFEDGELECQKEGSNDTTS